MRVGLIGLDHIGERMAVLIIKAGHQLTVYDPMREKAEALASVGATVANSIADTCRSADALFTMLADDETVDAVVLGVAGVVESLPRNAIHISSSTISVECSDRLVEAHWDAGQRYISAPVLGPSISGPDERLLMIAAGCDEAVAEVQPLLDAVGELLAHIAGWPSDANQLQLSANALLAPTFESLRKRAPLMERAGHNIRDYVEFLTCRLFGPPVDTRSGETLPRHDLLQGGAPLRFQKLGDTPILVRAL